MPNAANPNRHWVRCGQCSRKVFPFTPHCQSFSDPERCHRTFADQAALAAHRTSGGCTNPAVDPDFYAVAELPGTTVWHLGPRPAADPPLRVHCTPEPMLHR